MKTAGVALRATFIVDPDNVIQHVSVNNLNAGRNPDDQPLEPRPGRRTGCDTGGSLCHQVEIHQRCDSRLESTLRHGCERRAHRRSAHGHEHRLVSVCRDGGRRLSSMQNRRCFS